MARITTKCGTATISNGGTTSGAIDVGSRGQAVVALTVEAPAALTGTVTVHASADGGTTYKALYNGADITITANKVQVHNFNAGITHIKFISGSAEGADRTFGVYVIHEV